jgi:hypothetical protein
MPQKHGGLHLAMKAVWKKPTFTSLAKVSLAPLPLVPARPGQSPN